jgi:hypothetical protein
MAISDMLNRRVRARPATDDDEVYSEQSDAAEEVSQDKGEEDEGSDAESESQDVRFSPAVSRNSTNDRNRAQRIPVLKTTTQTALTLPLKMTKKKNLRTKTTISKPP